MKIFNPDSYRENKVMGEKLLAKSNPRMVEYLNNVQNQK
jgi:hypothetical protein